MIRSYFRLRNNLNIRPTLSERSTCEDVLKLGRFRLEMMGMRREQSTITKSKMFQLSRK